MQEFVKGMFINHEKDLVIQRLFLNPLEKILSGSNYTETIELSTYDLMRIGELYPSIKYLPGFLGSLSIMGTERQISLFDVRLLIEYLHSSDSIKIEMNMANLRNACNIFILKELFQNMQHLSNNIVNVKNMRNMRKELHSLIDFFVKIISMPELSKSIHLYIKINMHNLIIQFVSIYVRYLEPEDESGEMKFLVESLKRICVPNSEIVKKILEKLKELNDVVYELSYPSLDLTSLLNHSMHVLLTEYQKKFIAKIYLTILYNIIEPINNEIKEYHQDLEDKSVFKGALENILLNIKQTIEFKSENISGIKHINIIEKIPDELLEFIKKSSQQDALNWLNECINETPILKEELEKINSEDAVKSTNVEVFISKISENLPKSYQNQNSVGNATKEYDPRHYHIGYSMHTLLTRIYDLNEIVDAMQNKKLLKPNNESMEESHKKLKEQIDKTFLARNYGNESIELLLSGGIFREGKRDRYYSIVPMANTCLDVFYIKKIETQCKNHAQAVGRMVNITKKFACEFACSILDKKYDRNSSSDAIYEELYDKLQQFNTNDKREYFKFIISKLFVPETLDNIDMEMLNKLLERNMKMNDLSEEGYRDVEMVSSQEDHMDVEEENQNASNALPKLLEECLKKSLSTNVIDDNCNTKEGKKAIIIMWVSQFLVILGYMYLDKFKYKPVASMKTAKFTSDPEPNTHGFVQKVPENFNFG